MLPKTPTEEAKCGKDSIDRYLEEYDTTATCHVPPRLAVRSSVRSQFHSAEHKKRINRSQLNPGSIQSIKLLYNNKF
jgi:hypothetical protein